VPPLIAFFEERHPQITSIVGFKPKNGGETGTRLPPRPLGLSYRTASTQVNQTVVIARGGM